VPLAAKTRWRLLDWPGWSRLALAGAYFAALNWALLAPSDTFEGVEMFPYEDKVVHAGVFLGLALLVRWAVPERFGAGWRRLLLAAALAAYAFGIESLQPVLTGGDRQFEWLDMACNYTGIAAGWLLFGAGVAATGAAAPTRLDT
jgi:hypothetical protein